MPMKILVSEFKQARKNFIRLINTFPKERIELILFNKWNLKNILAHLSGWAKYQKDTLRQLKKGIKIEVSKNLKDSINNDFVASREKWHWDRVYHEFLKLSRDLIKEYESLPAGLWKNKIYHDKKDTVEDFIKIEINHYSKTHGPKIKEVLENLKVDFKKVKTNN